MPLVVADLSDLVSLLEAHEEWQLPLLRVLLSKKNVRELLAQDTELLLILRGLMVGEELARLPAQVEEVKQIALQGVQIGRQALQAAERAQETAERAYQAAERAYEVGSQANSASQEALRRLQIVETDVAELKTTTKRMDGQLRGIDGRLRGEEYQRRVRRIARQLFNGGEGGTPEEPHVEQKLWQWLAGRLDLTARVKDVSNPALADLIWWKGERVAVVEASLKVNGEDIRRALLRAETLREAGVDAVPCVIGDEWANPETRALAEELNIMWKIDDEVSQSFIEFHRLAP
ncbi:MAG: hypothetical protein ACK4RG_08920 [Fimbriimonadales bacterium]